jgi:hypothetical protein
MYAVTKPTTVPFISATTEVLLKWRLIIR